MTFQPLISTDDLSVTVPTKINTSFLRARYLNTSAMSADFTAWADDATGDNKDAYLVTTGSSTIVVTLPDAAGTAADGGRLVTVIKADGGAGSVTIDGESAQTINGAATVSLASQYKYATLLSDGSNWIIIGSN